MYLHCLSLTFPFPIFWNSKCYCRSLRSNWKKKGYFLMQAYSWVISIIQSNSEERDPWWPVLQAFWRDFTITSCCIRACCMWCISLLYKCVVCMLYFSCCIFSYEQNNLITGEKKLEENCESEQKKILKLTASQDLMLLANGSLKTDLTLTIQILDVTQVTT